MVPDFQRALGIVLVAGTIIVAVGTIVLWAVFRRFGGKSHFGLLAALVGFIFVCCLALLLIARE